MFGQLKVTIVIVLGFITTMLICNVNAAHINTEIICKKLSCPAATETSCGNTGCFMNDSTVTFEVNNSDPERGYLGSLLRINNQTLFKVSPRQNIENATLKGIARICCNKTLNQMTNFTYGKLNSLSGSFEVQLETQTDIIFVFTIRNVSMEALRCFRWDDYRQLYGTCVSISPTNPAVNLTGTKFQNQKTAETYHLLTYCVVVTFLLLEVFFCAVLYLCLWEKRGRTKEAGNTAGNPIYQRGLQVLEFAPDDALSPTQDSYQPLVENTREPGATKEYQGLENEEGCDEREGASVDQEGYEGLVRNQTHKYQSLDQDKEHRKGQRKSDDLNPKNLRQYDSSPLETAQRYSVSSQPPRSPLDSQLNVTQSVVPLRLDASPFSPNKHQAGDSSHFDKSSSMPLYYVLESSGTTAEKGPACIDTHPKGSNSVSLQIRGVIEELKAAITGTSVEVDSTKKEPIYYVLEGANPTPESGVDHMHKVIGELKSLNEAGQRGESSNECSAVPLDDDVFENSKN